jgi:transcription elongation factor GreA
MSGRLGSRSPAYGSETRVSERLSDEPLWLTKAGLRQIETRIVRAEARIADLRRSVADLRENRTAADDEWAAALGLLDDLHQQEATLVGLRAVVERAEQIPAGRCDVAEPGSSVRVCDPDGEETTYTLVSPVESAPSLGRISTAAPLGRALVGHRVGELVTVEAPAGGWRVRILEIGRAV